MGSHHRWLNPRRVPQQLLVWSARQVDNQLNLPLLQNHLVHHSGKLTRRFKVWSLARPDPSPAPKQTGSVLHCQEFFTLGPPLLGRLLGTSLYSSSRPLKPRQSCRRPSGSSHPRASRSSRKALRWGSVPNGRMSSLRSRLFTPFDPPQYRAGVDQ